MSPRARTPAVRPPQGPPGPEGGLVKRDRIGIDVPLELMHLERNLGLSKEQAGPVTRGLKAVDRLLRAQAAERRAHRDKALVLHAKLMALNGRLEKILARQAKEEAAARRRLREVMTPQQRRHYDLLNAERRRVDREWAGRKEEAARGKPPPRGAV